MNNVVVISKYNENLSWKDEFRTLQNFVIYDKSSNPFPEHIPTRNVGREAHTLVKYIYENYYNLPDYVIFLQGNPYHRWTIQYNLEDLLLEKLALANEREEIIPVLHKRLLFDKDLKKIPWYKIIKLQLDIIFQDKPYKIYNDYVKSAQMVIPKTMITNKSFEFWERLYNFRWKNIPKKKSGRVDTSVYKLPNAWIFEYIWVTIFYNSYK